MRSELVASAVIPLANCSAPGWASQNGGTTGGGTAAETTVTNYAQLKAAIENSAVKVIKVTGTITVSARLSFQDQTGKQSTERVVQNWFLPIRRKMVQESSILKDATISSSEI
jgi:pectate lyase